MVTVYVVVDKFSARTVTLNTVFTGPEAVGVFRFNDGEVRADEKVAHPVVTGEPSTEREIVLVKTEVAARERVVALRA